jgi:disulfide bond formation protein DsbB
MTVVASVRPGSAPASDREGRFVALTAANLLALLLPAALLAGAWGFQLIGGYTPCEMCHWQRWPHYAALAPAALAFAAGGRARVALVALAALLIAASGVIGVLHAGVEYHWWRGFTACTAPTSITGATAAERLASLLAQPVVRCDAPAWTLGGVSMAGFNALFSLGGAALIGALLWRRAR